MKLQEAIERGLARSVAEPECENYFDVYGREDNPEWEAEVVRQVDTWGVWHVRIDVRAESGDRWSNGASLGMVFGNEVEDTLTELWPEAEAALDGLFQEKADELSERATYAAG